MAEGGGRAEAGLVNGEAKAAAAEGGKVLLSDDMLYKLSKKIAQLTKVSRKYFRLKTITEMGLVFLSCIR